MGIAFLDVDGVLGDEHWCGQEPHLPGRHLWGKGKAPAAAACRSTHLRGQTFVGVEELSWVLQVFVGGASSRPAASSAAPGGTSVAALGRFFVPRGEPQDGNHCYDKHWGGVAGGWALHGVRRRTECVCGDPCLGLAAWLQGDGADGPGHP